MERVRSLSEKREEKIVQSAQGFIDDVLEGGTSDEELDRRLDSILENWKQHKESEERRMIAEKLWTPDEVAAHIHKSKKTVMQYLRENVITGVKVGREWMIADSDLQAYIDGLKAARNGKKSSDDPPVLIV